MENSTEVPQKVRKKTTIRSSNFTSRYLPKENKSNNLERYIHPYVYAASFTIAKIWKQPKCSSIDEWMKKMWHIRTTGYYSAIPEKKREGLPFATTWMDLEGIILSEVSQRKANTE